MNSSTIKQLAVLFTTLVTLSGCLEHRYQISALRDKSVDLSWELSGDRPDIEDGNELWPDSALWQLVRTVEESEDRTTHTIKGNITTGKPGEVGKLLSWGDLAGDSVFFTPHIDLKSITFPIVRHWSFEGTLPSRQFIAEYGDIWDYVPDECRILEDDDALRGIPADEVTMLERKFGLGIIQWNRARYEVAFDRVWAISLQYTGTLADTTETGALIARAGWVDDIHIYLNELDVGEPQTANLNWWGDLRPLFLGRFANLTTPDQLERIGGIADAVEKRYVITKDLEDDSFVFTLVLPAIILETNGEREGTTVTWEIPGKEVSNSDFVMKASAIQIDYFQAVGIFIILLVFGWRILRHSKRKQVTL